MAFELSYLFNVFYDDEQFMFSLPSGSTVEDVKLHIYEKTKIRPSKQNITGWTNDPINESQVLSSFLPLQNNILWVLSTDNKNVNIESSSCSEASYSELSNMLPPPNLVVDEEREEEITDVEACISFIAQFISKYGDNHVPFHDGSLGEAIAKASFTSIESRKIIALYFYNEDDKFSRMLCPTFTYGEIRNILETSYYVIGWDVSEKIFHSALKKALNENLDFEEAQTMLNEKHSALFIIYPIENSVEVFSVLHGEKVNTEDVLTTLKAVQKNFMLELQNECELDDIKKKINAENNIGSREFQQLMYDRLGDRDYDCFEYDEHDYLKEKIGFAKFGPPQNAEGYNEKQTKIIEETYKQICINNNKYSEWQDQILISFIYNCLEPLPQEKIARSKKYPDYNPNTDMLPVPIFVIRKCTGSNDPCRIFIDNDNRVYESWKDYLEDNQLYKCKMILPLNGHYLGDSNGNVILENHLSPACGIGHTILKGTDIASTVAGLASGGVFIAAMVPAITVAPIALTAAAAAGIGVGVYSVIRSAVNIYDRKKHGENMSFANSEARGAYINIVAGSLGFVGAGATSTVSLLAARGVNIGQGARLTVTAIGALNIGASGAGIVNSTYGIIDDWLNEQRTPSLLTVVQLSSSILFFGNAVYNFRSAGTIIEESQTNALREHQESLRSNRHRRTFNKMIKETIRQNNGDASTARAEVISTIRNMGNKDETFAILTRNNKVFNKAGVRFSAENGQIKLNGVLVDLLKFETLGQNERSQFLIDLPQTPQPTNAADVSRTMNNITSVFDVHTVNMLFKYGQLIYNNCTFVKLVSTLLQDFSYEIQGKVIKICKGLWDMLRESMGIDFPKISNTYFSNISKEPLVVILRFVIDFIKIKISSLETEYEQRKTDANEENFNNKWGITRDTANTAVAWFERVVNLFVLGTSLDEVLLKELIQYVMNIITLKVYDYSDGEEKRKKREENTVKNLQQVACKVCEGYYYNQVLKFIDELILEAGMGI